MAHELGLHRVYTYALIRKLKLWPVVNAARVARIEERRAQKLAGRKR